MAFALIGAACGGGEDTTAGSPDAPKEPTHGAVALGLDTGAAALTQTLTHEGKGSLWSVNVDGSDLRRHLSGTYSGDWLLTGAER